MVADGKTSDGRWVYWHYYRRVSDGKEAYYCSLGGCSDPDLAEFLRLRERPRTKSVKHQRSTFLPRFIQLVMRALAVMISLRERLRLKP
jgi:hypothetical protein